MRRLLSACLLVAVPFTVSGCQVLGSGVSTVAATAPSGPPAMAEVVLTQCGTGGGAPQATGTVTNTGQAAQSYVVDVGFFDATGKRVDDVFAQVKNPVAPAASASWTAATTTVAGPTPTCRVISVERTPA